jgi:hypothetical protein
MLSLAAIFAAVALPFAILRAIDRLQCRRDKRHRAAAERWLAEHPGKCWPPVARPIPSPPRPPGPPVEILGYQGGPVSGLPPTYRSAIKPPTG